jgi:hypothetical protein
MPGTKLLSAFLIIVPATILLTAETSLGEPAADQCKPNPVGAAPRGSHWFYHINRATKQHCWYLGPNSAHLKSHAKLAGGADTAAVGRAPEQADADDAAQEQPATAPTMAAPPASAQSISADVAIPAPPTDLAQAAPAQLPAAQSAQAQAVSPQAVAGPAVQATAAGQAAGGARAGTQQFGTRWPEDLPKADDLVQSDPAPVSNSYAERHDPDATAQMPAKWPLADTRRGAASGSVGERLLRYFSIAGIVAIPLLLLIGWVGKHARMRHPFDLGERWQSVARRLRPRRELTFAEAVFAEPAPNGPVVSPRSGAEDRRARRLTDPKQDLKTSLAELMRDLRRAAEPGEPGRRVAERSDGDDLDKDDLQDRLRDRLDDHLHDNFDDHLNDHLPERFVRDRLQDDRDHNDRAASDRAYGPYLQAAE